MSITVNDILHLPSFSGSAVLAGKNGLDNPVVQVSISDSPLSDVDEELTSPGDFYLSELYFARGSVEDMIAYLNPMINAGSSGLCILDEYIQALPSKIITYCDQKNFPVLLNSVHVPYAVMIREIMELIIADGQNALRESELSSIINNTVDSHTQLRIIHRINPHLAGRVTAFFVSLEEQEKTAPEIRRFFDRDILSTGVLYKGGVIGILSHSAMTGASSQVEHYAEKLADFNGITSVGISEEALPITDISRALRQAIAAASLESDDRHRITHYRDLGALKLLLLLSGHPELEDYYQEIAGSLQEYDKAHHTQLFDTMLTFHQCGYQYKKAAEQLFIHENTLRYRIDKIRKIIETNAPLDDFRESFSLALKCKSLIDR